MNNNPWKVKSIQAFACLKCPECDFDTKDESIFQDHAIEKHPLSFVLFGKIKSLFLSFDLFAKETNKELNSNIELGDRNISHAISTSTIRYSRKIS